MAVWPRTRGGIRPCPFCDSTLGIGATACRHCGLPLIDLTADRLTGDLAASGRPDPSPVRRMSRRLTQEWRAVAVVMAVMALSLIGLNLTTDFRGTNYAGQDLRDTSFLNSEVDLVGADFSEAQLQNADFSDQLLFASDFSNADLSYADLRRADITGADFRGANLSNARLTDVSLAGAVFDGADLTDTDLTGTDVSPEALAQTYRCRTVMPDQSLNSESC